jgi:predicted DNA-binding transcriptional regulator AlpA
MRQHTTRAEEQRAQQESHRQVGVLILRTPAAAGAIGLGVPTLEKMRLRGDGPPFVRLGPKAVGYRVEDLQR